MKISQKEYQELLDSINELNSIARELVETLKCMQPPITYPTTPSQPLEIWSYPDVYSSPVKIEMSSGTHTYS